MNLKSDQAGTKDSGRRVAIIETLENRLLLSAGLEAPQTFAAGINPDSVTVADVNGDGRPDLIVAQDEATGYVSVLLGNGNGTLQAQLTYAVGAVPGAVAVADVNGNGIPDLIVPNSNSQDVSVLLGNGNGTFQVQQTFAAGADPGSVFVADLNGDGRPDLIVGNPSSGDVSVLLGNGNGTFQAPQSFYGGPSPFGITLADVNGDGRPDLVADDADRTTIGVLLGNGNGTFQAPQTFVAGTDLVSLAVADVNGDQLPDVIAVSGAGSSPRLNLLLGNGNGTFQAPQTLAGGTSPFLTRVADMNGDGRPDLVVLGTGGSAGILLGNGNGTFQPMQTFAAAIPNGAALADLNGDGKPDLIVARSGAAMSLFLNDYAGTPSITQTGGTVTGTGTSFPDTASVSISESNVIVTIDGMSDSMPISSVTGITLDPGGGNDSVNISAGVPPVTVGGAGGNDSIIAANAGDSLRGGRGNDVIVARKGGVSDTAVGGGGNDTIATSGAAGQQLFGGPGDDLFINANGSGDSVDGGPGLNFAQENDGDILTGIVETYDPNPSDAQPDLDTVPDSAGGSDLQFFGTSGNDSITLSDDGMGNLVIVENGGTPQVYPEAGITGVLLAGGLGDDTLVAETSVLLPVTLRGAKGNDSLVGGGGDNVIVGGAGNDTLQGGDGTNDLAPGRRVTFVDSPSGNDVLIGGPAGSNNFADFAYRTDNLYLTNNGQPDSGDTSQGESTTIMPNVQNIFAGTGQDTVISVVAGSFISAGVGQDSLTSGGVNTTLVAGPPGAGEDTVIASGSANALFLQNQHADEYQGAIIGDILQIDSSDIVL